MKKMGIKIFACALTLAMALSLGACSKSDDSSSSSKSSSSSESSSTDSKKSSDDDSSSSDSDSSSTGKYANLEEYMESDEAKAQLESMADSMSTDEMTIDIRAEGNKLYFTYTLKNTEKAEGMEESMKSSLDAQTSTFTSVATGMKSVVDGDPDDIAVILEYYDKNGELIISQEFPAE